MTDEIISIPVGENHLVASVTDWKDGLPKEIYISIKDAKGCFVQDICMIRGHYRYDRKAGAFVVDESLIDCRVWANSDDEDYTHEFNIGIHEEDSGNV